VTGRVPVGSLGLFMRFIGVLWALIGVIGHFRHEILFEVKRSRKFAVVEEHVTRILGSTDVCSVLEPWEVWAVLDHVGVPVSDFEQSKRFYEEALSPLGYELIMEPSVTAAGFGRWGKPDFWISQGELGQAFHIAFAADDRSAVDAFHEAAMAAGGRDNGGPGLRPEYHASYYGAFVFDPDGNNIEAVCHGPQQEA
jgi:catechol 2,3-dioxygenase-like lactoylglutathione lyase family enzyme